MKQISNFIVRNLDVFAFCTILEINGCGPFSSIPLFCSVIGFGILRAIAIEAHIKQDKQ